MSAAPVQWRGWGATMLRIMAAKKKRLLDMSKARGPREGPDAGGADAPTGGVGELPSGTMTVSALLARVKSALAEALPGRVCVVGEISNLKVHSSGHVYFRLKDAATTIDAAMFRQGAAGMRFEPVDGLEVVVEGRVDVYEVRGQLQLYVHRMTPRGQGALELAFRQLCEKLRAQGLFAAEAKKPIRRFPRAVGVVTSPTGAAIRDIRRTLSRRWPAARVYLMGVLVQGPGAAGQIAEAVRLIDANAERYGIDTLIVARGGGSLEDLWAFNEEAVARAIFAAHTPVICGVGHEVDVTVADMVADVRAATPTAAAELAVPDASEVARQLSALGGQLRQCVDALLADARAALGGVLRSVVFRDPSARLRTQAQRTDELSHRLRAALGGVLAGHRRRLEPLAGRLSAQHPARQAERTRARVDRLVGRLAWALGGWTKRWSDVVSALGGRLAAASPAHELKLARQEVDAAARQLEAMSYRGVLRRGFSVTRGADGQILRSAGGVRPRQRVETELADGKFASRVVADDDTAEGDSRPVGPTSRPKARRRRRRGVDPDSPTLFDI